MAVVGGRKRKRSNVIIHPWRRKKALPMIDHHWFFYCGDSLTNPKVDPVFLLIDGETQARLEANDAAAWATLLSLLDLEQRAQH